MRDATARIGMNQDTQIHDLVIKAGQGDPSASAALLPLVYDELRRLAHWHMSREPAGGAGHTLQPTALVHEAFARLASSEKIDWQGRRHFFAAAALAMRRILVERARRVAGLKRGGDRQRVDFHPEQLTLTLDQPQDDPMDWDALDRAMNNLSAEDPDLAELVHLRYFAGLNVDQTAAALSLSPRTVDRHWRIARARLLELLAS